MFAKVEETGYAQVGGGGCVGHCILSLSFSWEIFSWTGSRNDDLNDIK